MQYDPVCDGNQLALLDGWEIPIILEVTHL